ncbi:hypothetical protein CLAFUW4_11659 [Fulvia fulva]|nr:hypothetical protein CLAFUR4_11664 [Fulvia fulva]WPV17244.1 hypothetical protein CLAFUW4_11659 [Fulvia fulva]
MAEALINDYLRSKGFEPNELSLSVGEEIRIAPCAYPSPPRLYDPEDPFADIVGLTPRKAPRPPPKFCLPSAAETPARAPQTASDVFAPPPRAPTPPPPPPPPAMQSRLQPFALADRSRRRPKLTDPYPELEGLLHHLPQSAREMPAPAPQPAPQPPVVTKRRERKIDILIRQKIEDEVKEGRVPIITPCYNNLDDPARPMPQYLKERLEGTSAAQPTRKHAKQPTRDAPKNFMLPPMTDVTDRVNNRSTVQTSHTDAKPIVNDARKRVRRPRSRPDTSYLTRPQESATVTSAPQHPRSALEDIIRDAPNDVIGEETYASLRGMAEVDKDHLEEKPEEHSIDRKDDILEEEKSHHLSEDEEHDLTQMEKDQRQEDLALEALKKRLNITHTTVQDANRGLRRLSNQMNVAKDIKPLLEESRAEPPRSIASQHTEQPQIIATQTHVCCDCHKHHQSVWGQLWTEFSSNFYTYDATRNFYHNITWLGWTVILWIIWFMTEMALYPYYANELFGPLFPFVTMNVCLRPFMPILVPTFRFLSWAIGTLFNIAFGETATSNGRAPPGRVTNRVLHTAASIPATTASITKDIVYSTWEAVNELNEHMGMGYDDYL